VALGTTHTAAELVTLASRAEKRGFDSFWLAELYHHRSAIPLAVEVGRATSSMQVGLGVLLTRTRHPALIAMEGATLDEMNGGRLLLGLGVGRGTAALHAADASLVGGLRDSLSIVGALLRGETVNYAGQVFNIRDVRLGVATRDHIPLYVGCYPFSPKALQIAGALADGVLYTWPTPALVRRASESIAESALRAGRDPSRIDISSYFILSIDDDAERARQACRPIVAEYTITAHTVWRKNMLVDDDEVDPVLAAFERGGHEAAVQAVGNSLLEKMAIAGDPAYCRDRLAEYVGTGLNMPIAYSVLGPEPTHALDLLSAHLVKHPRSRHARSG
jgi:5,10-methylenetetrahydromethanopterin reductase